jgi:hypothetical protein
MAINYQLLLTDSVDRLSRLLRERRRLDEEIERLQRQVRKAADGGNNGRDIITLADPEGIGLTQAISHVFQTYDIELTAVTVRDLLPTLGFDTSKYKDPLLSIHAILKRLVSRDIITRRLGPRGSSVYVRTDSTQQPSSQV